ncbi:hypothetical protein H6F78_08390 [Coleofasciculus sp. FACHB-64]|uniref:hypothetical protein n=1 Tax=Cyanophyceae TaxID=3028117 RepID=UPI001689AA06|nr:hypothetical protein [Coleofasciculus sp. FACHB-501]MBD1838298.1 hypothetical protein [Coleofasciculus sp. FACHB-501]MBD2045611.1 hypothetical protein [Coleofasciculus sp. FACHB-64]
MIGDCLAGWATPLLYAIQLRTAINHHCFQVWKVDDKTWHNDIRVKAATFLRARDDKHWMGCHRVDSRNNDVFDIWKDQRWHSTSRVQVATRLR